MNYQVCVDITSRSVSKTAEGGRGMEREGEEEEGGKEGREEGREMIMVDLHIHIYVHKIYKSQYVGIIIVIHYW